MAVDDSYTKALLHMNGADASTTFTDESGKTWTANATAQIDTAYYKFGGASGLFDGNSDYIDTPDSDDWNVGTGDWTVDFWMRRVGTTDESMFGQGDSAGNVTSKSIWMFMETNKTKLYVRASSGTTIDINSGATTIADTNWHHIAGVRYGNTVTSYIDGVSVASADATGLTVNNSTYKLTIGRNGEAANSWFNGNIDEFRFSKGIARWTSNFTPPNWPYATPRDNNSVLYISDYGVM